MITFPQAARGVRFSTAVDGLSPRLAAGAALMAALGVVPGFASLAVLNELNHALVFGLFAIGFNLVFNYSGLLSFGHAIFFGTAAYAFALTMQYAPQVSIVGALLGVTLASALFGALLGHICVRRSGAYFSMTTLAIGALFYTVAFKWDGVTGGTDGLYGFMPIDATWLPGIAASTLSIHALYGLIWVSLAVVGFAAWALLEITPFGHAVALVRQNEQRAAFLGYATHRIKVANFVLGASVAGMAGALWAVSNQFVSTSSIDLKLSTVVIIIAFIGGAGWVWGPLVGAVFYTFGSDWLSTLTPHWPLWLGLVFIGFVLVLPQGLSGVVATLWRHVTSGRGDA